MMDKAEIDVFKAEEAGDPSAPTATATDAPPSLRLLIAAFPPPAEAEGYPRGDSMTYWYRYEDTQYAPPLDEYERPRGEGSVVLHKRLFEVVRTTPKGVWLRPWYEGFGSTEEPRFVRTEARKRFACPSETEALESFVARKAAQLRIYEARAKRSRKALALAQRLLAPASEPASKVHPVCEPLDSFVT